MKKYIGIKVVEAKPMARGDYNEYRGWTIPADENPADEGYLVQYLNDDYESWCPKEAFEKHNSDLENLCFSRALYLVKEGAKVQRKGWNGKGMFIFLVPGSTFKVSRPPLLGIYEEGTEIDYHAHIDMRTADGQIVPWLCSQTDVIAEDWQVIE